MIYYYRCLKNHITKLEFNDILDNRPSNIQCKECNKFLGNHTTKVETVYLAWIVDEKEENKKIATL